MLAVLLIGGVVSAHADDEYTVKRISNPDSTERQVDGLIPGGDRENSYTWRMAMRGDYIYIATTRNIASALVNMYAPNFTASGMRLDDFWKIIDAVDNGDIPRNDDNNRRTGQFRVVYTGESGVYYRMAVTFGDNVYFGSYSANPSTKQYILKLDTQGNFTKVFETKESVSLRANCEYDGHLFFGGVDESTEINAMELMMAMLQGKVPGVPTKMAVMRKSNDDGATWGEAQVVAAGDGSSAAACGYGDPAIVRTLSGKLICLMAAGSNSFPAGMLHMGYSESTDNGLTWSAPVDIYSKINKNRLNITSAFTSSGKGVCFSNGRVAFAMNGVVSGTCNEYILYSDDEGGTWTIASRMACASADESKLEIMNDNTLLMSVRQGGWNSMANRAYARTTEDASTATGINRWTNKKFWTDLNANGCNADIMYYSRESDGQRDMLLHTVVKDFRNFRRDLRLYMSFDQGATWQEAFQLQPGYAAYSSMQKLANGDLAIIFEDGSLGNQDKQDCYAMTYIVISRETLEARAEEVIEEAKDAQNTVKIVYGNAKETELGAWDNNTSRTVWTSTRGGNTIAGLTMTKSAGTFDRYTGWNGFYNLAYKVGAVGREEAITLTAPEGYLIKSYSFKVQEWSSSAAADHFTIVAEDGTTISPAYKGGADGYTDFSIKDIYAPTASFTVSSTDGSKYLAIINFVVVLIPQDEVGIRTLTGDATSFDRCFNLAGQRVSVLGRPN